MVTLEEWAASKYRSSTIDNEFIFPCDNTYYIYNNKFYKSKLLFATGLGVYWPLRCIEKLEEYEEAPIVSIIKDEELLRWFKGNCEEINESVILEIRAKSYGQASLW